MKARLTISRKTGNESPASGPQGVRAAVLGPGPRDPARARRIDPRWIGHYRALLALRRRLVGDRADELLQLASPLEPHGMSPADSATDAFDHDMLLAELSNVQDRLFEVDEALRRIENNAYGFCELTGKPIAPERLRAIPWTRFTEEAGELLENQQALERPHFGELHSIRTPGSTPPVSAEDRPEFEQRREMDLNAPERREAKPANENPEDL